MWLALALQAHAVDVGTAEVIFDYPVWVSPEATGTNAAVTVADGGIWVAVEWAEDKAVNADSNLDLFSSHDGGATWARRTLSDGELHSGDALMFPSVETWPGEASVHVVGKRDDDGVGPHQAHLQFFQLDRDAIATAPVTTSVVGRTADDVEHGRVHLAYDHGVAGTPSEALYACYTRHDVSPLEADDVWSKGKAAGDRWIDHPVQPVSQEAHPVIEDHCQMGFGEAGERLTTWHRGGMADDAKLRFDAYDPVVDAWTNLTSFTLVTTPHIDVDFPSLSVAVGPVSTAFTVVAQRPLNDDDLVWWSCDVDRPSCDTTTEWGDGVAEDVAGRHTRQPEAVTVGGDRYVAWQSSAANVVQLGIASMCSGESTWTFLGTLPKAGRDDCDWAADFDFAGSSVSQVDHDETDENLHATYLCAYDGPDPRVWVPVHWSIAESSLCP